MLRLPFTDQTRRGRDSRDYTAGGGTHRVRFILKTYKLEKKDDFSEIGAPGLNGEPLQFVRGHSRTLSMVRAGDAVTDGLAVIRAACLLPYRPVSMTD